jgi:hypothetical protein
VGPRAVLDAVVKRKIPSSRRESNPRTPIVQPVAQTDKGNQQKNNQQKSVINVTRLRFNDRWSIHHVQTISAD